MTNTARVSNARANYTTGAVLSAPVGTALPTSAAAALAAAFTDWGFVNSDGITKTIERETENVPDMNGDTILVITKSHSLSFKFKAAEVSPEGLRVAMGDDNVTVDSDGNLTGYIINSGDLTPRSYVFNLRLSNNRLMRIVCPKGQVKSIGDEAMKLEDLLGHELEIEMLPDASGNKAYVYFAEAGTSGADILAYSVHTAGMDFAGDIDVTARTVDVTVPSGTTLTALVATFALSSGATAKIGSTAQESGVTSNSFSSPKTYDVTAGNGATSKSWTVTVTAATA